jgi:PAS domain S-box-containing protein
MQLADGTALIAAIADDLPAGVWVATVPDGRFVYANRAFEKIMGMGPIPEVGVGEYARPYGIYTRDGQLYPEERMPFVRALRERAIVVVDDIVIHRRDGGRVFVRAFAKPMLDSAGTMTHVSIAFFDITREAQAQEARHHVEAQLAQAERLASVGMLAAGVAHEVNNPLSYVIGSLELAAHEIERMRAATLDDSRRSLEALVRDALSGADRVRSIVRDLKVFSRVQEQKPAAVDVLTALEASIKLARNEIRHRARLVLDLASVPPVWGDEGRLGQLFVNLLINAAQAIPDGAAEANEIRVVTRPEAGDWIRVEIRDSGVGIPRESLPRIFDPFFTTKATGTGIGLGLSICHAIATDLSGRIEVDSEPGRGSTFRVFLPATARAVEPNAELPSKSPTSTRRATVLVVDDEPLILRIVASLLEPHHDVTCEPRSEAALQRIRRGERFDAILCDLMMPQVTGMDLYETLLEIAPGQAQAMLFLTGGAFTARARAFLDRVPGATIEKPFDANTLLARVRELVG